MARTLVPLRAISEGIGLHVKWNQTLKQITVTTGYDEKGPKQIILKANSKKITVYGKTKMIDVPVKIYNGTTYVPLVASSPEGAKVKWDNKLKQATITYNDKKVVVNTDPRKVVDNKSGELTDARVLTLIKKVDEIANLSSIKQKQAYFRPYFTQSLLTTIIPATGARYVEEYGKEFKNVKNFSVEQNTVHPNLMVVTQTVYDYKGEKDIDLDRVLVLIKEDGVWKVRDYHYHLTDLYELGVYW